MPDEYATDDRIYRQVIVTFKEPDPQVEFSALVNEISELLKSAHIPHKLVGQAAIVRVAGIEAVPPATALDVMLFLEKSSRARELIQLVEENRPLRSFGMMPAVDDPRYHEQWALDRMNAEPAWAHAATVIDTTAAGIAVAILDTGIHTSHPDLSPRLWDDGTGNHGFNVLTFSNDVFDEDGHGTMLAGTVGAISNNTIGIAAAGWPIRLIAVKFHDIETRPSALNAALAIGWALLNKASIIVAAWGVGLSYGSLELAIKIANGLGVLFVAAAGNDGLNNDELKSYPASYDIDNVVSVMASDLEDDKPGFSNYGLQTVHLAAPGVRILSTHTHVDMGTARYKIYSGTSPACAHVAYAAALLKTMNPGWSPLAMREHLIASVDPFPWLHCQARGRLSLSRAVIGPFMMTLPLESTRWPSGGMGLVTWTNAYDTPRAKRVKILVSRDSGEFEPLDTGPNNGSIQVKVPDWRTNSARIRLEAEEGPGLFVDSKPFKIE